MKPNQIHERNNQKPVRFFFFNQAGCVVWQRAGEDKGVLHHAAILLSSPLTPQLAGYICSGLRVEPTTNI